MKRLNNYFRIGNMRLLYFLLTFGIIIFACVSVTIGVANITLSETAQIIWSKLTGSPMHSQISQGQQMIIWNLRIPRILMALLSGMNLAITGAVYQAVFRNDMADPYMLGVSSGASLGAAIGFCLGGFSPLYAFLGAMLANGLVILLSGLKGKVSPIRLLLAGLAINYFFSAFLSFIRIQTEDKNLAVFIWGMGTLSAASYKRVGLLLLVTAPLLVAFFIYRKELNLLLMGEEAAKSMGVDVTRVRQRLLIGSSLLLAINVSFTGTIGFVGLIIPHIVRLLFGSNYKRTLPLCGFFGMYFLLFCDDLARALSKAGEIPLGIVTALLGAPYFMYLIYRERKKVGR